MKQVAIVGFAPSSRDYAPYDDPEWEIWGLNDAWTWMKRADRWFDLHSRHILEWGPPRRESGHVEWLARFPGQVYLIDAHPDIPNSVRYPLERVMTDVSDYLTSSIAYMLALAIHEKYERIVVYGVEMATASEYGHQRPCCEYLIGLARGRGIEVGVPEGCNLLSGKLYGRGELNPGGERLTANQFRDRLAALEAGQAEARRLLDAERARREAIEGAFLEVRTWIKRTPPGPLSDELHERQALLTEKRDALDAAINAHQTQYDRLAGAVRETKHWIACTPEGADPALVPLEGLTHPAVRD